MMEQPKSAETEQKPAHSDPHPNPNPDPNAHINAPNGDGSWGSLVMGSESQTPTTVTAENPNPMAAGRKSVRWSPELVSESTYSNDSTSYPYGSNPYVASSPSPAPSSSFNFKGA